MKKTLALFTFAVVFAAGAMAQTATPASCSSSSSTPSCCKSKAKSCCAAKGEASVGKSTDGGTTIVTSEKVAVEPKKVASTQPANTEKQD